MNISHCFVCYDSDINSLIYEIKFTLNKLSDQIVRSRYYGYGSDKKAEEKVGFLHNYLRILEDENRKVSLGGEVCLKNFKKQALAEKVRKLTTNCDINKRKDLIVDESREQLWIANNPYCVSREKWEKLAYAVCRGLRLEVQREQDKCDTCDLRLDVLSEDEYCNLTFELTRNIIPCDIIVAISIQKQLCDLDFKITRTEEECKLDFDILVNEVECDLSFSVYKTLIDCNYSFDMVKAVYENGCTLEVNGAEIMLVSALNKYPMSKLNFDGVINPADIKKLNINTKNSKYLNNPQAFIDKLKSDYGKRS